MPFHITYVDPTYALIDDHTSWMEKVEFRATQLDKGHSKRKGGAQTSAKAIREDEGQNMRHSSCLPSVVGKI